MASNAVVAAPQPDLVQCYHCRQRDVDLASPVLDARGKVSYVRCIGHPEVPTVAKKHVCRITLCRQCIKDPNQLPFQHLHAGSSVSLGAQQCIVCIRKLDNAAKLGKISAYRKSLKADDDATLLGIASDHPWFFTLKNASKKSLTKAYKQLKHQ